MGEQYTVGIGADTSSLRAGMAELGNATAAMRSFGAMALATFGVAGPLAGMLSFVKTGIAFNSTLEIAQRSLAIGFRANVPDIKNFAQAMTVASDAVAKLQARAASSSADFSDLLESYSMNIGNLFGAGITDLEKQLELISLIGEAVKSRGLGGNQFIQEVRALLAGNFNPSAAVATSLFRTEKERGEYRGALQSGDGDKVTRLLMDKLAPFAEGQAVAAQNFDVAAGNLSDVVKNIAAMETRGMFKDLTQAMINLTEWLKKPENIQKTKETAADVASMTTIGLGAVAVTTWGGRFISFIKELVSAMKAFGTVAALGAWFPRIAAGFQAMLVALTAGAGFMLGGAIGEKLFGKQAGYGAIPDDQNMQMAKDEEAARLARELAARKRKEAFDQETADLRKENKEAIAKESVEAMSKKDQKAFWMGVLKEIDRERRYETNERKLTALDAQEIATVTKLRGLKGTGGGIADMLTGKTDSSIGSRGFLTQGEASAWAASNKTERLMLDQLVKIHDLLQVKMPSLATAMNELF